MDAVAVAAWVPAEEYLSTDYSPDCDYVDGALEDRNVGEKDHSKVQMAIAAWLHLFENALRAGARRKELGIHVFPEQRIRITSTRYRVPDICVTIGEPDEQVFTAAPFLCIEILSPEDRMSKVLVKIADYLGIGVAYVWLIDPRKQKATVYTATEALAVEDGMLCTQNPEIVVPFSETF